jgi:hypothetical protein
VTPSSKLSAILKLMVISPDHIIQRNADQM